MNLKPPIQNLKSFWLWPAILLGGIFVLALLPGGFAEKSKVLLHGLCAQTPGHTFSLGGQPLPFDARMTGIYTGVAGTHGWLAFRGKLLAQHLPPKPVLAAIAIFAIAMAADGFNSLLTDLGLWHPWTTTNSTRLVTGYGAGIALAVALIWLLGSTAFQVASRMSVMDSWKDVAGSLVVLPVVAAALAAAPAALYLPIAALLVVSAWVVLATLATVTILLVSRRDERVVRRTHLHLPGAVGLILGLGIMLVLAFGRQWLESTMGIPSNL